MMLSPSSCAPNGSLHPAQDHRLAKKRKVMLKELRDQPFLLLRDDHCFRDTTIEVCKRAAHAARIVLKAASSAAFLVWWARGWAFPSCRKWRWSTGGLQLVAIGDERAHAPWRGDAQRAVPEPRAARVFTHLQSFANPR